MRQYVRARELEAAGMDWTDVLAVEAENKRQRLPAELLASDAHSSTGEHVVAPPGYQMLTQFKKTEQAQPPQASRRTQAKGEAESFFSVLAQD
jgi:hypothetical protein